MFLFVLGKKMNTWLTWSTLCLIYTSSLLAQDLNETNAEMESSLISITKLNDTVLLNNVTKELNNLVNVKIIENAAQEDNEKNFISSSARLSDDIVEFITSKNQRFVSDFNLNYSTNSTFYNNNTFLNDTKIMRKLNNTFNETDLFDGNETLSDDDYLDQIRDFIFPKTWTWVLIFFHSVVFVIGLVGNTLVCIAVYRNHTMRTVTNYFIVNLAVADFLVILFCLPPSVIWDVTMTWFFGIAMCKIVLYLQVSTS